MTIGRSSARPLRLFDYRSLCHGLVDGLAVRRGRTVDEAAGYAAGTDPAYRHDCGPTLDEVARAGEALRGLADWVGDVGRGFLLAGDGSVRGELVLGTRTDGVVDAGDAALHRVVPGAPPEAVTSASSSVAAAGVDRAPPTPSRSSLVAAGVEHRRGPSVRAALGSGDDVVVEIPAGATPELRRFLTDVDAGRIELPEGAPLPTATSGLPATYEAAAERVLGRGDGGVVADVGDVAGDASSALSVTRFQDAAGHLDVVAIGADEWVESDGLPLVDQVVNTGVHVTLEGGGSSMGSGLAAAAAVPLVAVPVAGPAAVASAVRWGGRLGGRFGDGVAEALDRDRRPGQHDEDDVRREVADTDEEAVERRDRLTP